MRDGYSRSARRPKRAVLQRLHMKGGTRGRGFRLFCFLMPLCLPLSATAASADLRSLAEAGAPELALRLLEAERPDPQTDPVSWRDWLRQKAGLLQERQDWAGLAAALDGLPVGVPAGFRRWAVGERARALLAAGHPGEARRLLAGMVWEQQAGDALPVWRQLIIQTYLAEGRRDDALAAMQRFRQDYGDGDRAAQLLRAEVMLNSDRPADALRALSDLEEAVDVQVLELTARLRLGAHPREVIQAAERLVAADSNATRHPPALLGLIAEAAARAGDPARQVLALEQWLRVADGTPPEIAAHAAELWDAYLAYAQRVGNRMQLLVGDDEAWFALAAEDAARYPVRTRSLLAYLALHARNPALREEAHAALSERVLGLPGGPDLLARLFLEAGRFAAGEIPQPVRYPLIDRAIESGDLATAARLLTGLDEPPSGADRLRWQLRRAKVFILAGEFARGAEVLKTMIAAVDQLNATWRDRLIQVVFDLQTVGEHDAAYDLFGQLAARSDPGVRRELLYWMADSRRQQERWLEAARLYLMSAILPGPETMDPWAQTARYQAAQAMTEAGLLEDAGRLYRQLLGATDDPKRQAVLRREVEQLVLRRQDAAP